MSTWVRDLLARSQRGTAAALCVSFAAYAIVHAVFATPWLCNATRAIPGTWWSSPTDERLVAWILAWVAHALATDPWHLFDANINYPAPGQLAGIEHFLSTQVVFGPVFWLTGNAILGANVAVLLSYPRAALGTPLRPLDGQAARALIAARYVPKRVRIGTPLALTLRIVNAGSVSWPAIARGRSEPTYTVHLLSRWFRSSEPQDTRIAVASQELPLRRDLAPGDQIEQTFRLTTPPRPGVYDIEIAVRQLPGAAFEGAGNTPLRARVEIVPSRAGVALPSAAASGPSP